MFIIFPVIISQRDEVHSSQSTLIFHIKKGDNAQGGRRLNISIRAVVQESSSCHRWCCGNAIEVWYRLRSSSLSASMPANGRYLLRGSTRGYRYDKRGTDVDKIPSRNTNTRQLERRKKREREHAHTHSLTAGTYTGNTTDDIINTVPEVYCIPGGRFRGESREKKERRRKLSNTPLAWENLGGSKLHWHVKMQNSTPNWETKIHDRQRLAAIDKTFTTSL